MEIKEYLICTALFPPSFHIMWDSSKRLLIFIFLGHKCRERFREQVFSIYSTNDRIPLVGTFLTKV